MTDRTVRRCARTWARIGVAAEDVADMAGELADDLAAAVQDGRDPESYVGGDPDGFARAWAAERGVVPLRPRAGRVAVAALAGALPGGFAGLFPVFGLQGDLFAQVLGRDRPLETPAAVLYGGYALCALFAWAGALAAVSAVLRFHADAVRRPTIRALAVTLPVAGAAVALLVGMTSAALGHRYGTPYVLVEMAAPALAVAATAALTRLTVLRAATTPVASSGHAPSTADLGARRPEDGEATP
ncbi:hypothetical protein [Actinomadura flavalba]|uniref:hypothetical protein n=1 Tax=Actinomadura flavalba TaxID=1120938 RepID=UPI00036328CA|nr:hypothetical protein [Actinomadura flavalba]